MIVSTIGGIVAAYYGSRVKHYDYKPKVKKEEPKVQEKKPAPVVEYRNKNINRWAMKKPIVRRIA